MTTIEHHRHCYRASLPIASWLSVVDHVLFPRKAKVHIGPHFINQTNVQSINIACAK